MTVISMISAVGGKTAVQENHGVMDPTIASTNVTMMISAAAMKTAAME